MSFDANKDGKLSKDELPERMQTVIARYDADKTGSLDKTEIQKLAASRVSERPDGRGGPEGRGGRPGGRGGPEGRGRGGPPSPEDFVSHAMEFDADKDGKLSKAELAKFAEEEFANRGARGGGPGGGFGGRGRGGGPGGDDRPQRPARPE